MGWKCPLCAKKFTHLEADLLIDPYRNTLACDVCSTEVVNIENEAETRGNKDRMQRLVLQTKVIVDLLKELEALVLPRYARRPSLSKVVSRANFVTTRHG